MNYIVHHTRLQQVHYMVYYTRVKPVHFIVHMQVQKYHTLKYIRLNALYVQYTRVQEVHYNYTWVHYITLVGSGFHYPNY